jgi:hypothetical protein
LLGVLGTGARISLRYPGAREPDRLLLAGREENSVLGSVWHSFNFNLDQQRSGLASGRGNLFYVFVLCIIRNMQCYVVVCK